MNRPIKFRAWNKEWKMMLPVDSLSFDKDGAVSVEVTVKASDYDHEKEWGDYVIGDDVFLMQFTGLHDKNGKEIYEGDIVEFNGKNYEVWYRLGCFFACNEVGYENESYGVIGNIYENPELLKA